MNDFIVGDKVICINNFSNSHLLKLSETYTISGYTSNKKYILLEEIDGEANHIDNFKLVINDKHDDLHNRSLVALEREIRQTQYQISVLKEQIESAINKLDKLNSQYMGEKMNKFNVGDYVFYADNENYIFEILEISDTEAILGICMHMKGSVTHDIYIKPFKVHLEDLEKNYLIYNPE